MRAKLSGATQFASQQAFPAENTVTTEPGLRIFGVLCEPARGAPQAKTVAPFIHVTHQRDTANFCQRVCQQNLQVTDGGLFQVVTLCIAFAASHFSNP